MFVERDQDGKIKGAYRVAQPGYAEEEVADDAAELVAFLTPTERRKVLKSVVISRLTDAQLEAALGAMTTRQKERWRAPDHPAIYHDDPEAVALVQFVGADPSVVLAP